MTFLGTDFIKLRLSSLSLFTLALALSILPISHAQNSGSTNRSLGKPGVAQKRPADHNIPLTRIYDINVHITPDRVQAVLLLEGKVLYYADRAVSPDRIFIDLLGARLGHGVNTNSFPKDVGVVKSIKIAEHGPTSVRFVIQTNAVVPYSVNFFENPARLVVEVFSSATNFASNAMSVSTPPGVIVPRKDANNTGTQSIPQPSSPPPVSDHIAKAGTQESNDFEQGCLSKTKGLQPQVIGVDVTKQAERVRVLITLCDTAGYKEGRTDDPDQIFFDLLSTRAVSDIPRESPVLPPGPLKRVRVIPHDLTTTRIVLDTSEPTVYSAMLLSNPPRLQIDLPLGSARSTGPMSTNPAASASDTNHGSRETPAYNATTSALIPEAKTNAAAVTLGPALTRLHPSVPESITPANATAGQKQALAAGLPDFSEKDRAAAVRAYMEAAKQGNAEAQFRLASSYATGNGIARDYRMAAKWYAAAARQNHMIAANNLGVLYSNGSGVPRSDADALKFFEQSAHLGYPGGQNNLGAMYLTGRAVARDDAAAAKWLRKAADNNVPEAQYSLATLYINGRGVPQNDATAVEWLRKAATQGYGRAQLALGKMCIAGKGTAQSAIEAITWFRQAAAQGLSEADYQIALMYQSGQGVSNNDAEAAEWFRRAAQAGVTDAQYVTGQLYRGGRGVPRDLVSAYAWFALAAAHGSSQALAELNTLAPQMTMQQIADAQQLSLKMAASRQPHSNPH